MARRRGSARIIPFTARSASPTIITVPSGGGMRRRSRRSSAPRKRRRSRRSSVGGSAGGFFNAERAGAMAGGFLLGMLDKQGTAIPTVPMLGRAGTLGVGLYFLGKQFRMPMMVHASTAALAIATYELGNKGTIAGLDTV